jgi:hypothetical protein
VRPLGALLGFVCALLAVPAAALAAGPPNDSPGAATTIAAVPATVSGFTTNATMDADEPAPLVVPDNGDQVGLDRSVWFAYTPPSNLKLLADTCDANFDSHLDVYSGEPGTLAPVPAASNDYRDCPGDRRSFSVTANVRYLIRVAAERQGNRTPDGGVFHLKLTPQQPPANDNFTKASLLPGAGTGIYTVPLAFSTLEFGEPSFSDDRGSVWYRFATPISQPYTAQVPPTPFEVRLAVYQARGSTINALHRIGSDYAASSDRASVDFNALKGNAYYVRLSTDQAVAGDATLNITTNTAQGLGLIVTPGSNTLRGVRRAGFRAALSCARTCRLSAELLVSRTDARRLHLTKGKKKPRNPVRVGQIFGTLQTGQATNVTVPISAKAVRRKLAHARAVHFLLRVSILGARSSRPVTKTVVVR